MSFGAGAGKRERLKELNPFMLSCHYIAHRNALCTAGACASIPFAQHLVVNSIASWYCRSAKRLNMLKDFQDELGGRLLKILRVHKVRWLSRYGAVKRILTAYPELMSVFRVSNQI
jgi:hypothetical protein